MKRKITAVLTAVSLAFMTGCWDSTEIKNDIIVAGISVDRNTESGLLNVGFEFLPMPVDESSPIIPMAVSIEGETLKQCVRDITNKAVYRPYLNHIGLVLTSADIAEEGVRDIVQIFMTDPDFPLLCHLAVMVGSPAIEFFSLEELASPILSYEATGAFMTHDEHTAKMPMIYIYEMYQYLNNPYAGYLIPAIGITDDLGKKIPHNAGAAVFLQDKMVGQLTSEEVQFSRLISNDVNNAQIMLHIGEEETPLSMRVYKASTGMTARWEGDEPVFTIKSRLRIATYSVPQWYGQDEMETMVREALEEEIHELIRKAKDEIRCDFFGFSECLERFHYKKWMEIRHNWEEVFASLRYELILDVNVID